MPIVAAARTQIARVFEHNERAQLVRVERHGRLNRLRLDDLQSRRSIVAAFVALFELVLAKVEYVAAY